MPSEMRPTGTNLELGDLPEKWHQLEQAFEAHSGLGDPSSYPLLTYRKFDEATTSGRRVYRAAERALGVAMDNHRALLAVLEHHGATYSAPWSLVRPTFEAAFRANWVLDPEHHKTRRARGLRCDYQDMQEQRRHLEVFEKLPQRRSEVRALVRKRREAHEPGWKKEASELGVSWSSIEQRIVVTEEIGKLRLARNQDPLVSVMLQAQWRWLSGMDHGWAWAMLHGADQQVVAETEDGIQVELTMNDDTFSNAARATLVLLWSALARFRYLHTTAAPSGNWMSQTAD